MDNLLPKFGAKRIVDLGLGDDDDDIEGDFQTWKEEKFWPTMKKRVIQKSSVAPTSNGSSVKKLPKSPYSVEYISGVNPNDVKPDKISEEDMNSFTRHYFTAVDCPIIASRELRTPKSEGSTIHVEIDITKHLKSGVLKYETADNLAVLPVNDEKHVSELAAALGYNLDDVFRLKPGSKKGGFKHLFPTPITVRECLSRYCDLTVSPRRSELKSLANYAHDPTDKKALLRMASKDGKEEYKEKIVDAHIGILEIITKFCKSIDIPLEHFIDVCPRLLPRYYTISSSSSLHPKNVHITVAVLEKTRKDGSSYKGICSNHLASLRPFSHNNICRVFCRDSSFRLPLDSAKPIIMIGPGTGIAPMRAMLQERSYQRLKQHKIVGKTILYFGCQNRSHDFLYSSELEGFQKDGTLTSLYLAFSRETKQKVYVQHLLRENDSSSWDLIDREGAYIYICGGTKMGHDVVQTLLSIFKGVGGKSDGEATTYLKRLESEKRLVQELWS